MGFDIAALMGFFGIGGAFTLIAAIFAAWMAWRIVEKAGLPGWVGLGAVLLTLTGVGTIVPLVLLWIFAFMRWPRDALPRPEPASGPTASPTTRSATGTARLAAPARALSAPPLAGGGGWRLSGAGVTLAIDGSSTLWILTGAPAGKSNELSVPDPSVGQPHARLLVAGDRLGLEDLGTPGGTYIDGARLLPEHGPRDISVAHVIRVGIVELTLSKAGPAE
jgi:hypothetical protein